MKRDPRSNEAALKYLLIGASSSAIFLYGLSLLYGLSGGETTLEGIAAKLTDVHGTESLGLAIALVFVIAGIAFKISAVPFHQWTPDVYEGSLLQWLLFSQSVLKLLGLLWRFAC